MDLIQSRIALRERPLLDVFDLALRFCASHARDYAKLSACVLLPGFAGSVGVAVIGGWWLGWAATVVATAFASAPFVVLASRLVFADDVGTGQALLVAARALPLLAVARLVQAFALAISLLVAGLPWLWMGPNLSFAAEVILLERPQGIGASTTRARRIAQGQFGAALATLLLLSFAPLAAALVGDVAGREVLGQVLEVKAPPSIFVAGGSWLALAGWWAVLPLIATAHFFVYLDIRTRTEGWDIQTRFAAIAAKVASGPRARKEQTMARAGAALFALAFLLAPAGANAADASAGGESDVRVAIEKGGYSFCSRPREPLGVRARILCAHSDEIPNCPGFAAACANAAPESPPARRWSLGDTPRLRAVVEALGLLLRMTVWLAVAAIALAVLFPVARALARIRRSSRRSIDDDHADVAARVEEQAPLVRTPSDSEELLARADDFARGGRLAEALELYLAASLRALDERGKISLAKDRTNGEYVRSCPDADAKSVLKGIVCDVDRVKFGGEEASPEVVSSTSRRAAALVRALSAGLALLALGMVAGGCARSVPPRAGDDPAGDELWYAVVEKGGFHGERLARSLASLPLDKASEEGPAVVVDAERTQLDDETREHLTAWVEAGGVLVLAGAPDTWPREFGVRPAEGVGAGANAQRKLVVLGSGAPIRRSDPGPGRSEQETTLSLRKAVECPKSALKIAWFDEDAIYAALVEFGNGRVLAIATDELLTNVGLVRPGAASAMLAIFSNLDEDDLQLAQDDDGVSPASTPIAALSRAGLGLGLLHACAAAIVLFLAVGVRLSRAKPSPPPPCRAFAEHVEAVGALYARARSAPLALAAYSRFAEERLRERMTAPSRHRASARGAPEMHGGDVGAFLSERTRLPLDVCRRLWARAVVARDASTAARGDEIEVLEELSAACGIALSEGGTR